MTIGFFNKVGYVPPWVGYFVKQDDELGSAAFKGPPVNGAVEIAYGTWSHTGKRALEQAFAGYWLTCFKSDSAVRITARTLPEENFSTRLLEKMVSNLSG